MLSIVFFILASEIKSLNVLTGSIIKELSSALYPFSQFSKGIWYFFKKSSNVNVWNSSNLLAFLSPAYIWFNSSILLFIWPSLKVVGVKWFISFVASAILSATGSVIFLLYIVSEKSNSPLTGSYNPL